MNEVKTFINYLKEDLSRVEKLLVEFINTLTFQKEEKTLNPFASLSGRSSQRPNVVFVISPLNDSQSEQLAEISNLYNDCIDRFSYLLRNKSEETKRNHIGLSLIITGFIEGVYKSSIELEEKRKGIQETIASLQIILNNITDEETIGYILVPDTNALIKYPNVSDYLDLIDQNEVTVVIPSSVISELDKLKNQHTNLDFRNKVKGIIKRLKGWRNQGDIFDGITINKNITLKFIAEEPDFVGLPYWLNEENNDDCIIAAVIDIQRKNPSSKVQLITYDLNMQNKAILAHIPFLEPPDEDL